MNTMYIILQLFSTAENPCSLGDSGCDHICYTLPDGSPACACNQGYELGGDKKSCIGKFVQVLLYIG